MQPIFPFLLVYAILIFTLFLSLKKLCARNNCIKNEFGKWRAVHTSVGGVGGMLAWVT